MKWCEEADLVVVGFGAAGAAAAITGSALGASVLILEKQPKDAHTPNVYMSGGLFTTVLDPIKGARYFEACAGGLVPFDAQLALAERASTLLEWLTRVAPNLEFTAVGGAEHQDFTGAEAIKVYQIGKARFLMDFAAGTGRNLFSAIRHFVEKGSSQIEWNSSAQRLVRDESGAVVGVDVLTEGQIRRVRARHGVILTCGGFEYNEKLKRDYLPAYPMHFYGNTGNTGDGVRMAQDVGADLWHMSTIVGRAVGKFRLPDGTEQPFHTSIAPPGYVITDRTGKRFTNEDSQAVLTHSFYFDLINFDPHTGTHPRVPCFWFFDERRRKAGPLSSPFIGACGIGRYEWSKDNSKEIENGWLVRADTIEELAKKSGVDQPDELVRTISDYNKSCVTKTDAFGRSAESMIPLDQGPYYCVQLWPGGANTTGGPRRDKDARVLDAFETPIRGLYAAGELGQVSGKMYPADGFNICEALCFGQIAAETALKSTAQDAPTTPTRSIKLQ